MVDKILKPTGIPYKESRFLKPPKRTYAVFNDSVKRYGADNINLITQHDTTIELYEYEKDPESEALIEAQFNALGVEYEKQARYWIQEEQLYQVVYEFSYTEKGGF